MEQKDFLAELSQLVNQEDVLGVGREVSQLRSQFDDYVLEEERKWQIAQLDAQEQGQELGENTALIQLKEQFFESYGAYKSKKQAVLDAKNAEESLHLSKKRTLIKRLRETIQDEENIGAAFATLKEIQESWKNVGDIPREKRDEIQSEYSKLIEDFYYNINIYKQLQDHDFRRNTQLKEEIIEQLKELQQVENIKEVETKLKALQNDWEDIGPVVNEEWDRIKEGYWTNVRANYDRINAFYEERRNSLAENLQKKQALLEETEAFVNGLPAELDLATWEEKTKVILSFQEAWKGIGFGPKKENEEIWKAFRAQCDRFFDQKKLFFDVQHAKFDKLATQKQELIAKAEELKSSTDWKETSNQLIQLQKEWKKIGHSGRSEQKLWKNFRAACDEFFTAKEAYFAELDKAFEVNLVQKNALIDEIKNYTVSDKSQALTDLKEFAKRFSELGRVPLKQKDAVYADYKAALDSHYAKLKLEGAEKEKIMFQARLDTLAASPEAGKMFRKERQDIYREMDKLKAEIIQFENNLGFFANSKGADALKKEVESKINRTKDRIEGLKLKLKQIPNE